MKPSTVPVMMGIASPTGSHLPALSAVVESLEPCALVIEHGAGMYSTPLLCRYPVRVLCAERHPGWLDWARWMYAGRDHEIVHGFKELIPRLAEASAIFIDGESKERGDLLLAALERRVPNIVAHDTNADDWQFYGFQPGFFNWRGYRVTHTAEDSHRTTAWRLLSS